MLRRLFESRSPREGAPNQTTVELENKLAGFRKIIARLERTVSDKDREIAQLTHLAELGLKDITFLSELPPEELRLHIGTRTTAANFYSQGWSSSMRVIEVFGNKPPGPVLDWGCGSGRTANWLLARGPDWQRCYHGCDVDPEAIEWLRTHNIPQVKTCNDDPPLPYDDGSFAAVYSFSVMTHIPAEKHRSWYQEIARVLEPGGRAFFTIQGDALVAAGQPKLRPDVLDAYKREGYAYQTNAGHYKDAAIVSQRYAREAYEGILDEESYVVGGYQKLMDAFVLRKI